MIIAVSLIPMGVLGTFILLPAISQAWFFSAANAQTLDNDAQLLANSFQDMPLLVATVSMMTDLKPVDENQEVHIVDNEALMSDRGVVGTSTDLVDIPTTDTISSYIVQPGDSVAKVAKKFGVSENTIRWANNLKKTDVLRRGQELTILPITGVRHKVAKGDTIETIAKKYKADLSEVLDFNNLDRTEIIKIGDILIIPNGEVVITQTIVDKKTGTSKTVAVTGTGLKGSTAPASGYYMRPIETNGRTIIKTQGFHGPYNAYDIGAPRGTTVKAMADGVVIAAKSPKLYNGGYGGMVIISHSNGSQTLYAHLNTVEVSVGQKVSQGVRIGGVGNTGRVVGRTGLHLHYEIRGVYPTPKLY